MQSQGWHELDARSLPRRGHTRQKSNEKWSKHPHHRQRSMAMSPSMNRMGVRFGKEPFRWAGNELKTVMP